MYEHSAFGTHWKKQKTEKVSHHHGNFNSKHVSDPRQINKFNELNWQKSQIQWTNLTTVGILIITIYDKI